MPRSSRPQAIVTLTMNPAVDLSVTVDQLQVGPKLRCHDVRRDPGGGGINVARVMRRLGGRAVAVFPAGGPNGERLEAMLSAERTPHLGLAIAGETREDITVQDAATGGQYRLVMPGPRLSGAEVAGALRALGQLAPPPPIVVASGSLPPGAPVGFYGKLARRVGSWGGRLALDTSGAPLRQALDRGVWLVKPNLAELEELVAAPLPDLASRTHACRAIVAAGQAQVVALSMGSQGALLVDAHEVWRAAAPPVAPASTVGAGDSFTAALVLAFAMGLATGQALVQAVAAGTAALLAPGTQLCRKSDARELAGQIMVERLDSSPRATRSHPAAA